MTLPAKQARRFLISLIAMTTASLAAMAVIPIPIQTPSRQIFGTAENLFKGARHLRKGDDQAHPSREKPEKSRTMAQGIAMQWEAGLWDGRELSITEMPLRVRSYEDFDLKKMKKLFSLDKIRLNDQQPRNEANYTVGKDQILITATDEWVRTETCITENNIGYVSQQQLVAAVRDRPLGLADRMRSILGLRQPREWQCLYVSTLFASVRRNTAEGSSAWQSLRQIEKGRPKPTTH
jgi:hypothetical protein